MPKKPKNVKLRITIKPSEAGSGFTAETDGGEEFANGRTRKSALQNLLVQIIPGLDDVDGPKD